MRGAVAVAVLGAVALAWAAPASAATPPVLSAPAAGADYTEGGSITFRWSGTLQGDADARSRSYFRLEVAETSEVPDGAQSVWTDLETFAQTSPGVTDRDVVLGVPLDGTYRWRVCAWGVVDDVAANELEQLPGGCSTARTVVAHARSDQRQAPGTIEQEQVVVVPRDDGGAETEPEPEPETPADPIDEVKPERSVDKPETPRDEPVARTTQASDPVVPSHFEQLVDTTLASLGDASRDELPEGDAAGLAASRSRDGVVGSIADGLTATVPGLPIPYWTLALLMACFPIARYWRRSMLAMFDDADGAAVAGLHPFAGDQALKDPISFDDVSDATAAAPSGKVPAA